MVAVKLISIPLTGILGVLVSTSPLMHIGATRSNYKTKWYERADFSQPIFENCNISEQGTNPINVYLAFTEEGTNVSQDSKKVSLKVVEKSDIGEKVVWGVGSDGSNKEIWEKLKLQYSGDNDKKVKFMYPYKVQYSSDIRTGIANCESKKVEFVNLSGSFRDSTLVELKDITLSFPEGNKCIEGFSSIECQISIGPSEKLKWIEKFQPKVTYTAF